MSTIIVLLGAVATVLLYVALYHAIFTQKYVTSAKYLALMLITNVVAGITFLIYASIS